MRLLLTKSYNIVLIIIIVPLTLSPLCLLLLVRLASTLRICAPSIFTGSSGNWPLSFSFRSSGSARQLSLSPHGVLLTDQVQGRPHPRQGCSTTDYAGWDTYSFSITHSPITHSKFSLINLVSIFRCSSSPRNPEYARRIDPSVLACSLSLHRHPHICIPFSSRFICCS